MRECKSNCKTEGPPGPIWCRQCGHAPSCCNCDDWELVQKTHSAVCDRCGATFDALPMQTTCRPCLAIGFTVGERGPVLGDEFKESGFND